MASPEEQNPSEQEQRGHRLNEIADALDYYDIIMKKTTEFAPTDQDSTWQASGQYLNTIHPAELTLRDTLDTLKSTVGESQVTNVLLGGFNWNEREDATKALEIIPGVPVPFEPRKVFDEQVLPACWVMPRRRLAVSAPVHADMSKDKVKRLWRKADADLDQKKKDVRPLYQVLWCSDIGSPVSCASWDVSELTVALSKRNR
jgi:hypothetical protein